MSRGRKPKPEAIKALGGRSHKKKEVLPELDIDTTQQADYEDIPTPRQIWDSLVRAGVAKASDRLTFLRLQHFMKLYSDAAKDVEKRGMILKTNKGGERYNPSWRIMRDSHQELLKIETEFGMTPSSKRRMPAVDEKKENSYAAQRAKRTA